MRHDLEPRSPARGLSLIGMLITMVCMVVLAVIGLQAMNKAVTGEGSVLKNTVRSFEDQNTLRSLHMTMAAAASDYRGWYIYPSLVSGSQRWEENTTANLFSVMVMNNYVAPEQLISANEYSPDVWEDDDYDWTLYDPAGGVHWDPGFLADLSDRSNVSYAHMPLFGERYEREWQQTFSSRFPLLGNRGPQDGEPDPQSYSVGDNGQWAGHAVFGDGSVRFFDTMSPGDLTYERNGERHADNLFKMEDGPDGRDAILAFTREMTPDGPELQFD